MPATTTFPFSRRIGILGHPTTPDVRWTDRQLATLRETGFETLQLHIAWGGRPGGEVLNLEDLENETMRAEWHRRLKAAARHGLRTLAHFGIPKGPQTDATTCISDPNVLTAYQAKLRTLFEEFPTIDEVMIYTYDQDAWLCSSYGPCPRCQAIPLEDRLIPFLEGLVDAVQQAKPGARLWWEPWELSAGQTLAIADRIRPDHFGLILHHTIAEVQFTNTTDIWFRNLARLAGRRGIPVIGEGFFGGAGEDIHPLTHLACPRLVFQQLDALRKTDGVVGIKEYYGLVPDHFSVNTALLGNWLNAPDTPLRNLVANVAEPYGSARVPMLEDAWENTATAMELFPWDASWALRRIFDESRYGDGRAVCGASWQTPSWQANRRGFYMVTDEPMQSPWLREDVALRARLAARTFETATEQLDNALATSGHRDSDLTNQRNDVARAAQVSARYAELLMAHLPGRS